MSRVFADLLVGLMAICWPQDWLFVWKRNYERKQVELVSFPLNSCFMKADSDFCAYITLVCKFVSIPFI